MYFKSPMIFFLMISHLPELDLQLDSFFSQSVSDDAVPALSMQILSQGCPAILYQSVGSLWTNRHHQLQRFCEDVASDNTFMTRIWQQKHRSCFPFPGEAEDSLHDIYGATNDHPSHPLPGICATLRSCNYQGHGDIYKIKQRYSEELEWRNDWLTDMPDIYGHQSLHLQYLL